MITACQCDTSAFEAGVAVVEHSELQLCLQARSRGKFISTSERRGLPFTRHANYGIKNGCMTPYGDASADAGGVLSQKLVNRVLLDKCAGKQEQQTKLDQVTTGYSMSGYSMLAHKGWQTAASTARTYFTGLFVNQGDKNATNKVLWKATDLLLDHAQVSVIIFAFLTTE